MAEQRLIDGSCLYAIESLLDTDIVQNSSTASWLMGQVLHDIKAQPTIHPEDLPVVQQLREELMLAEANQQHFKEERDEFEFKMREVAEEASAEINRRNKTITELREELKKAKENYQAGVSLALNQRNEALDKLARVTAERDAAVKDLEQAIDIYRNDEGWDLLCRFCNGKSCREKKECDPEWRGLKKEATP